MAIMPQQLGIGIRRRFTDGTAHPYDQVAWERRDARIPNYKDGGDAFFQPGVEFPNDWSLNASAMTQPSATSTMQYSQAAAMG